MATDDDERALDRAALAYADAIRTELRETVQVQGVRAIRALLLMERDSSLLQKDVQKLCGTSKMSIGKYRKLLDRLKESTSGPPTLPRAAQR